MSTQVRISYFSVIIILNCVLQFHSAYFILKLVLIQQKIVNKPLLVRERYGKRERERVRDRQTERERETVTDYD